ncbi:hypothetical protein KCU61_g623, partial [Aureobasidium melanogenum]
MVLGAGDGGFCVYLQSISLLGLDGGFIVLVVECKVDNNGSIAMGLHRSFIRDHTFFIDKTDFRTGKFDGHLLRDGTSDVLEAKSALFSCHERNPRRRQESRTLSSVLHFLIEGNIASRTTLAGDQIARELVFIALCEVVLGFLNDCLESDEVAVCLLGFVKITNPYGWRFEAERTALEVCMRANRVAVWCEANAVLHGEENGRRNQYEDWVRVPSHSVLCRLCSGERTKTVGMQLSIESQF